MGGKYAPTDERRERYLAALVADKRATAEHLVAPALPALPVIADCWVLSEMAFWAVKHARPPGADDQGEVYAFGLDVPGHAAALRAEGVDSRRFHPPVHCRRAYAHLLVAGVPVTDELVERPDVALWSPMEKVTVPRPADTVPAIHARS